MENKAEEKMLLGALKHLETVIKSDDQSFTPHIEVMILLGHLVDWMISRFKLGF
jgi:hypothetical protein